MLNNHLCPCCSQTLLRHITFKRTFWFCNHCYQEMPDLTSLREAELEQQHWLSKNITLRQQIESGLRQSVKLPSSLKVNKEVQQLA